MCIRLPESKKMHNRTAKLRNYSENVLLTNMNYIAIKIEL